MSASIHTIFIITHVQNYMHKRQGHYRLHYFINKIAEYEWLWLKEITQRDGVNWFVVASNNNDNTPQ